LAAVTFEEILKVDTTNLALLNDVGALYMRMKSFDKAAGFFERRFTADPKAISAYINYGSCMVALEEYEKASKAYEKALALNPAYAPAQLNLARSYLQMKLYPESKKAYEAFIKLADTVEVKYKKELAEANRNIGLFFLIDKKAEDALKYLQKSTTLDDNDSKAHLWLGQAWHNLQTKEEQFPDWKKNAIKEYKKTIKLDPKDADARRFLEILEPQ
jgi:tetratricopeptide (TPR) repeat protein